MNAWQHTSASRMMRTFGAPMAMLVRGQGARVWDADGNEYLDFLAGIAVNALGHAHPVFVEAISRQAATIAHVSNYFATPSQLELAERLVRISGAGESGRVFFGNSGAEANEAAFKLARLNGGAGKPRILALTDAFHGRTLGSLALTGKAAMRAPFEPMPGGVEHIDSTIEALEEAMGDDVAALFIEPIKGEAGVLPLPDGYLQAARDITSRHGALLIIDEIQTGAGRTGEWFAFQHAGITPDAITVAKGIGGGVPIGALITFGQASELFTPGHHGSTFGGNPLMTATANAVLGEIEHAHLVQNAADRGSELKAAIEAIGSAHIEGVRGEGLLLGVALTEPRAGELTAAAMTEGLIINAANPSTVRLAPPLIIDSADIAEFVARFTRALATLDTITESDAS